MTTNQVWLITGAGRRHGVDIAKAALAAGHAVVATGRDPEKVKAAIGDSANLLALKLDVTRLEDAERAVDKAVKSFGRIDVLINNAGNCYAGFFEELSPQQVRDQIETLLFGPMNVIGRDTRGTHWARSATRAISRRRRCRPNIQSQGRTLTRAGERQ